MSRIESERGVNVERYSAAVDIVLLKLKDRGISTERLSVRIIQKYEKDRLPF